MSLNDLFANQDELLASTDWYGEAVTMFDPVTTPPTETTIENAIVEILGNDPLVIGSDEEATYEQGTIEVPAAIAVSSDCWFVAKGVRWNFVGRGGRDANYQTINVQNPQPKAKRTATRRGN